MRRKKRKAASRLKAAKPRVVVFIITNEDLCNGPITFQPFASPTSQD